MKRVLVDSNVILDIFLDDPNWVSWSLETLSKACQYNILYINPIIYSEVSIGFDSIETLETALLRGGFKMSEIPKEALFLAGKVSLQYKKRKGSKESPLPDFFIGAHAAVMGMDLITRDTARYQSYFPTVNLIHPN